ncbi:MAG: NHL repeat-containing protein [Candidatus Eisenbacteria bacterium]|nr:NHL repeat-containing protein [Candidatus Eisenbacteria bacterium]
MRPASLLVVWLAAFVLAPCGRAAAAAPAADPTGTAESAPASPSAVAGDTAARALRPQPAATDTTRLPLSFEPGEAFGVGETGPGRLVLPGGVATDAFGRVYVSDAATHRLLRWNADGTRRQEAGSLGSAPNQFRRPGAVARLGSLGVAVLDVENRRVVTYDLELRLLGVLAGFEDPDLEASIGPVTPIGLAADRGGAVYVADADGDRVLAFDFSGRFLRAIGGHGPGEGWLRGLSAITVAPQGVLMTADRPHERGPARLQWMDAGGRVVRLAWVPDPAASSSATKSGALALAVDDAGRVAIADEGAGTLALLSPGGALLARTSGLARPGALAFAPDGTLLVAERGAARVRRFAIVTTATGK